MKTRFAALAAGGAAVGMTVALLAGSAAFAAKGGKTQPPAPTPTPSYSCASFTGAPVRQAKPTYSGVALRAGDTIVAKVASVPSSFAIDLVTVVQGSAGYNITFYAAPVSSGLTFKAPATGVYEVDWSIDTNGAGLGTTIPTWTFTCKPAA
ncbi:hypothetical protein LK09_03225 [Microbacterium mangrovi]|uniref:Uncharacterized protein n=1 Tax=Microbacterium mangrovi TaxID=1348253 RepID=A0A0B2ACM4_9MICO|nr:hypothetical protein [Microbacterium mangrovi]KHK99307.1 hypothetical protein LK09_03225 [Microbacterium mangrovi]